uniref:Ribonuclease PIN domain-containing protein n=1 Tax=Sander lucioperca TaxID=283035 RepID=A0A8C9YPV4_SANLU
MLISIRRDLVADMQTCLCCCLFVLQDIGSNIYTLKDVVDEIRDKPTRRSLAFLPYTLNFKEPHPEHIRLGIN